MTIRWMNPGPEMRRRDRKVIIALFVVSAIMIALVYLFP